MLYFDRQMIARCHRRSSSRKSIKKQQGAARDQRLAALPGNATMCPSTAALAVVLVPGARAEEVQLGQLMGLAITLVIALSAQLVLAVI
jgi:hypothetical protein